jgi:transposase-like protein
VEVRRENQRLRREREILKTVKAFFAKEKRVKFAFIATEKVCYPTALMCRGS